MGLVALLAWGWPATVAHAANITYNVDPTQSQLTISGAFFFGASLQQQEPGSLSALYTGTITAIRDAQVGDLQITGGNVAAQNSGSWAAPLSVISTSNTRLPPPLADYGVFASVPAATVAGQPQNINSLYAAIRNFSFSLASSPINSAAVFDASQLSSTVSAGEVDYMAGVALFLTGFDISRITGQTALASGSGSLVDSLGVETLTIPVNMDLEVDIADAAFSPDPVPLDLNLSGTIVATAPIPEPSSDCLIEASFLLLMLRIRSAEERGHSSILPVYEEEKGSRKKRGHSSIDWDWSIEVV